MYKGIHTIMSKTHFTNKLAIGALLLLTLVVLSSCGFPGIVSTAAQLPTVKHTISPTSQLPPVRFPQDEAAHADLTEWWYYTGHMNTTDADGKLHKYGFELVIFQALRSSFPPVYASHFAISDVTRDEFHYDQRRLIEPNAVIPNGTSTKGIDVHVGDWTIQGLNGHDSLSAEMPNYGMHVDLRGLKPATLHNGSGLITYGSGGFSYYYSRTRMALSGTLVDHNQSKAVTGEAWMDHQWGNFLSLGGGGWDWYSIQLNNNTEMMLYFLHDASGATNSTYAGYIDATGKDHLLPTSALHSTVLDHWVSPVTKARYPSGWQLDINDSQVKVSLTITPQLKDQELVVYQSTGNSYWEGAVNIRGQSDGKAVRGEGYIELTGYAHG
ncbi:MAG: lipocalin-like domain-containing protein [Ktedonobacteraceae bacterium]